MKNLQIKQLGVGRSSVTWLEPRGENKASEFIKGHEFRVRTKAIESSKELGRQSLFITSGIRLLSELKSHEEAAEKFKVAMEKYSGDERNEWSLTSYETYLIKTYSHIKFELSNLVNNFIDSPFEVLYQYVTTNERELKSIKKVKKERALEEWSIIGADSTEETIRAYNTFLFLNSMTNEEIKQLFIESPEFKTSDSLDYCDEELVTDYIISLLEMIDIQTTANDNVRQVNIF